MRWTAGFLLSLFLLSATQAANNALTVGHVPGGSGLMVLGNVAVPEAAALTLSALIGLVLMIVQKQNRNRY